MSSSPAPESLPQRPLKPYLIGGIVALILIQGVVLSPKTLEDFGSSANKTLEPQTLAVQEEKTLADGIPKGKIPEYSIDQFNYVSTKEGMKQWQIISERAYLFNPLKLVHAREVKALLFDPDGKTTVVRGKEAKYFMNQRDLEIFGEVETQFPDGFQLRSDYLRYLPGSRRIEIPVKYYVSGTGKPEGGQSVSFDSGGLYFEMGQSEIRLPKDVSLRFSRNVDGKLQDTKIESDYCVIHRDQKLAHFSMKKGYVKIFEPTMIARSVSAKLNYGEMKNLIQYLTLYDDVLIKELGKQASEEVLRYATSGLAEFDSKKDVIRLSQFPQVYQDHDTVTGEVILMHRDTDVVEIQNSNAFSQGGPPEKGK